MIHDHVPFSTRGCENLNSYYNKGLLVSLLDINKKEYTAKMLTYCIRKVLLSCVKMKKREVKYWWNNFVYVYHNQKSVRINRIMAKNGGRVWI